MTTPNTPANGGQILTDERIYEVIALLGAKNNLPSLIFAADHIAVSFARLIEADIRAALVEPIEQVANVIEYLMHNKHEIKWTDGDGEPFSSDAHERAYLIALIAGAKVGLRASLAAPAEVVYQVKQHGWASMWMDASKAEYDACDSEKRVFAAPAIPTVDRNALIMRQALIDMQNPIIAMQREVPKGSVLNPHIAMQMASEPEWYKRHAQEALDKCATPATVKTVEKK